MLNPGWRILFAEMGLPVADTLRAAGLSPKLFDELPVMLDAENYFRFWDAMEAYSGNKDVPLALANALDVEVFSPPLYAAVCSHNLRQATHRVAKFKALTGPITIDVDDGASRLKLTWNWPPHLQPPYPLLMSEVLFWVFLARKCTRMAINPLEISTPVLPQSTPAYLDYIGAPIRRDEAVSITFANRDAEHPFISGNDAIWSAFEPALKDQLSELQNSASVSERVRVALHRAIPADQASAEHVASALSMTARTLQRRLQQEGTSFKALVNSTRSELAKTYLRNTELPLSEISFLLGYADPSSFNRAFREWTRTTPERYRRTNEP
ncbi:AraC family transcriptional regulator [Ruegeria sp. HKCCSP346]|uniref:AraC family transcriptional regulator n=2 Tax=unclassified Ruegeria TaxID=2625375 RepID=UPI001AE77252